MKISENFSNQFNSLPKPLNARTALGQIPIVKSPRLLGDFVVWLEQRPNEGGRTTLLIRPWFASECIPQELTLPPMNLRSRIHDYGGGELATQIKGDVIILVWIDDHKGCLFQQSFQLLKKDQFNLKHSKYCQAIQSPIPLCRIDDFKLADGLIDLSRRKWIGVMEKNNTDYLVSFSLDKQDQIPEILHTSLGFLGYATLSFDFQQIAWVEWSEKVMPWEESQLWKGYLDASGNTIQSKKLIAGNETINQKKISVFQPIWLFSGDLVVAEDKTGWWNLMVTNTKSLIEWNRKWPMEAEHAMPQWVYGMSTSSSCGESIVSASCSEGLWQLNLLHKNGEVEYIEQPFDDLAHINSDQDRVVAVASNSKNFNGLLEIDLNTGDWIHTSSNNEVLKNFEISFPESFWFEGYQGKKVHSWYYPPINNKNKPSPLLVKIHSGPTSMTSKGLNLAIQYWTSRGWGVVDVNYSGSTGFGREYRDRLNFTWGKSDVFDCIAAAKALINIGKANEKYIAIEGGSAGGFTTLSCLCSSDIFRVAACRYAVSDLYSMANETSRFEKNYINSLIGSLLDHPNRYLDRSPLNNAHKIRCPLIFFQGLKDKVVLPDQTIKMAQALKDNNIPVEVQTFADEGHGFRDMSVKIKVLEATEMFFKKHLNI